MDRSGAWNKVVAGLIVVWVGIPMSEVLYQLFRKYDQVRGRYFLDMPDLTVIQEWLHAPELHLLGEIAMERLMVVALSSIVGIVAAVALGYLQEGRSRTLLKLLIMAFFVPPILKTLAWSKVFNDFIGWEVSGLVLYSSVSYLSLIYGPYILQQDLIGKSALDALSELNSPPVALVRKLIWSLPSILLGTIATYALLVFGGDELRRFGMHTRTLTDLAASADPGRDRSLDFALEIACLSSLIFGALGYALTRQMGLERRGL